MIKGLRPLLFWEKLMARPSKEIKELAETHEKTMKSCPIFGLWVHRFLTHKERIDLYQKAYDLVYKGEEKDDEETI